MIDFTDNPFYFNPYEDDEIEEESEDEIETAYWKAKLKEALT
jgi:hypothetical protein